jgi:hypothetical protein
MAQHKIPPQVPPEVAAAARAELTKDATILAKGVVRGGLKALHDHVTTHPTSPVANILAQVALTAGGMTKGALGAIGDWFNSPDEGEAPPPPSPTPGSTRR